MGYTCASLWTEDVFKFCRCILQFDPSSANYVISSFRCLKGIFYDLRYFMILLALLQASRDTLAWSFAAFCLAWVPTNVAKDQESVSLQQINWRVIPQNPAETRLIGFMATSLLPVFCKNCLIVSNCSLVVSRPWTESYDKFDWNHYETKPQQVAGNYRVDDAFLAL